MDIRMDGINKMTENELSNINDELKKKQDRLKKENIADALTYLRKDNPIVYEKLDKARQLFEKLLKEAQEGKVSISKLEDALGEWYLLSLDAIVRLQKHQQIQRRRMARARSHEGKDK